MIGPQPDLMSAKRLRDELHFMFDEAINSEDSRPELTDLIREQALKLIEQQFEAIRKSERERAAKIARMFPKASRQDLFEHVANKILEIPTNYDSGSEERSIKPDTTSIEQAFFGEADD